MPEASIIITTYNRPHLLPRAVQSARAASCRDVEVIVVDDASVEAAEVAEATAQLCHSLPNVTYLRTSGQEGVAGARNRGILASCGEFLSFLDDDDVRLAGSLDPQIEALVAEPAAGFVYGQSLISREDGCPTTEFYPERCPAGDVFWDLLAQNFVPCGAALFRRSCLERVGLLDQTIAGIDDWDLWVRIAQFYPVLSVAQPAMIWRKSTPLSGQGTSDAVRMVELSAHRFRENWLALERARQAAPRQRREISRRFSSNLARHLLWESVRSLAAGQLLQSHRKILKAFRLFPYGVARALVRPQSFRFLLAQVPKERRALKREASRWSQQQAGGQT